MTLIAIGLSVVLIAGIGLGTIALTDPTPPSPASDTERSQPVSASTIQTTASAPLNRAIQGLVAAQTFRFELLMRRTDDPKRGAWRVSGTADMSTDAADPAKVQATVSVGEKGSYTVLSDQIRIGDEVYSRSPGTQEYTAGPAGGPGLTATGPVDPVSSILASASELPTSAFRSFDRGGHQIVRVDATGMQGVSGASEMVVFIDRSTGVIQRIHMVGRKVTSTLQLTDVGDPSISITAPPT